MIGALIEKEFKTTKDMVNYFLKIDERCRRDDQWLTYNVFNYITKKFGKNVYIPFELFSQLPQFETVKRCRALIQNNEGRYLPPQDVYNKRISKRKKLNKISDWI